MPYTVKINNVAVSVQAGSLQVTQSVGKKTQGQLTVRTDTSSFFKENEQIAVYDQNNTLVSSGYLTKPQATKPGYKASLYWTLSYIGQEYLAKKRVVQANYANKTCGYIARDIFANVLAAEGVAIGTIYDGPTCSNSLICSNSLVCDGNVTLPQASLFQKAADALDWLVQQASSAGVQYYWTIDQNKVGTFAPYGTTVGATIDDTLIDQKQKPTVSFSNPNYRNAQYVTGGVAQTGTQNETITGDGNSRSFTLGFPLASAPTITISGVVQTVGLKGTSGSQWYWAQGDNTITQDSGQTALASAATASVSYVGQYSNTAYSQNAAQVVYMASIDGSSGINEEIQTDNSLTTASNALTEASNLLNRYAQQGAQLVAYTKQTGFAPGQLSPVNMPYFGLVNTQALVESVLITDQVDGINIWYQITAVSGPYDTTWVDFWSRILSTQPQANSQNAGQTSSTSLLLSLQATFSLSASLNINVFACPITGNATLCGNSTIVC